MTCGEADDLIEAVVTGEIAPPAAFSAHLEGCTRCAAAMARARRIDTLLRARPAPRAPAGFTAAVASRIRGARWASEQQIDRAFNVALVLGLLAVIAGVAALFNLPAIGAAGSAVVGFVSQAGAATPQAPPSFSTYLLGSAFLGTALFVWWWAERRFSS